MSIEGIFVAPEAGANMEELMEAEVIVGRGIKGDRYFARKGTYSVFRASTKQPGRREPGRQITLMAAEGIEQACLLNGIQALDSLGDMRRNVVVRGLPTEELQSAIGREIRLGNECVVFVHRWTVPCMYNERKNCRGGLMEATWECAGVSCEVIHGGKIRQGDSVVISETVDPERVDGGDADTRAGFLVPPSKRTKQMVEASKRAAHAALPNLLKVDPAGVVRGLESYQSVGLQLFPRPKRFRRGEAMEARFGWMVLIFVSLMLVMYLVQWLQKKIDEQPLVTRPRLPEWMHAIRETLF